MIYTYRSDKGEMLHVLTPWLNSTLGPQTLCGVLAEEMPPTTDGRIDTDIYGSVSSWQAEYMPLEYKDRAEVEYCPNCRIVRLAILEGLTSSQQFIRFAQSNTPYVLRAKYHGNNLTLQKVINQVQLKPDGPLFDRVGWLGYVNDQLVYDGSDYGKKIEAVRAVQKYVDVVLLTASQHSVPPLQALFDRKRSGYYRFMQALKASSLPPQFRSLT